MKEKILILNIKKIVDVKSVHRSNRVVLPKKTFDIFKNEHYTNIIVVSTDSTDYLGKKFNRNVEEVLEDAKHHYDLNINFIRVPCKGKHLGECSLNLFIDELYKEYSKRKDYVVDVINKRDKNLIYTLNSNRNNGPEVFE